MIGAGLVSCGGGLFFVPTAAFGQSAGDVWDPVAGTLPAYVAGRAGHDVQPDTYSRSRSTRRCSADQLANAPAVGLRSRALAAAPRSS